MKYFEQFFKQRWSKKYLIAFSSGLRNQFGDISPTCDKGVCPLGTQHIMW